MSLRSDEEREVRQELAKAIPIGNEDPSRRPEAIELYMRLLGLRAQGAEVLDDPKSKFERESRSARYLLRRDEPFDALDGWIEMPPWLTGDTSPSTHLAQVKSSMKARAEARSTFKAELEKAMRSEKNRQNASGPRESSTLAKTAVGQFASRRGLTAATAKLVWELLIAETSVELEGGQRRVSFWEEREDLAIEISRKGADGGWLQDELRTIKFGTFRNWWTEIKRALGPVD